MFKSDQQSTQEFLSTLRMLHSEHSPDPEISDLLDCMRHLDNTEKKIDKALSKKRTQIQEYLTFCPQDIFTTLRIFINSEWTLDSPGQALLLHLNIFGQFLVNDDSAQLDDPFAHNASAMKLLRARNFVDLIRELRVDFLNFVGLNIRKSLDPISTCNLCERRGRRARSCPSERASR